MRRLGCSAEYYKTLPAGLVSLKVSSMFNEILKPEPWLIFTQLKGFPALGERSA